MKLNGNYWQSSDVATTLSSALEDAATVVASVSEPTLHSLGLGGWMPSGLVQTGLELLHTGLDVPWWTSIVIGLLIVFLFCLFWEIPKHCGEFVND